MNIGQRFRIVRHSDHVLPAPVVVRSLANRAEPGDAPSMLDIRAWRMPAVPSSERELPRLLVHAPRRTGKAVERNRFKRRTRMALLRVLEENGRLNLASWVIWVRPAKGSSLGCRVAFAAIEGQLRQALSRLG